jgi:CPA2 family monovalent cation:H+ antiporter-2
MLAILQSVGSTGGLSFLDIGLSIGITIAFIAGVLVIGSKTVQVSRLCGEDKLV